MNFLYVLLPVMNRKVFRYSSSSITTPVIIFVVAPAFFAMLAPFFCCFPPAAFGQETESIPPSGQSPWATSIWTELLQKTPYPHTAPLPPRMRSALDGTYTKFDPKKAAPVPCRRCPDYMMEGGIWKLNLDKGVFRIFHEVTGWRSLGSFIVDGKHLQLFNDPSCIEAKGIYRWTFADGRLILQVVEDKCAIGLRGKNLSQLPWQPF